MNYLESERYKQICNAEREALFALRLSLFSVGLSLFSLLYAWMENS